MSFIAFVVVVNGFIPRVLPAKNPLGSTLLSSRGWIHDDYANDDFGHILGINDENHEPSRLQSITDLRLKEVYLSKAPVDVQGCGYDPTFFVSHEDLESGYKDFDNKYGGTLNLRDRMLSTQPKMAVAAEFKRASPSKGNINLKADAVEQCTQYAKVGAAVISVLTEYVHFKGTLTDMKNVRIATQKQAEEDGVQRPAILRKDFILDKYQILEARANGADTVLLIVAILGVEQLKDLTKFCREVGMEPLVEVHTDQEMEIALDCGARVIGVNNRNLHTFQLDLDTTGRIIKIAEKRGLEWRPPSLNGGREQDVVIAALSGITSREDVEQFTQEGVSCVLVGETLMKSADPQTTINQLIGVDVGEKGRADQSLVKVCGLTSAEDAEIALQAGAHMLGVIFAEGSPRRATVENAKEIVQAVQRYGERSEPLATTLQDKLQSVAADGEWFRKAQAMLRSVTLRKPLVVGVFQNQSPSDINRIVAETGIDLVQLHGDESASFCDQVAVPCLRVLHVPLTAKGGTTDLRALIEEAQSFRGKAVALVLDSRVPGTSGGGTGATFDWDVVKDLRGVPVILAGGLTTENVVEAIDIPGVLGVDVSSGVEVKGQPGKKDSALVKDFIEATRAGEGKQL